MPPVNESRGRGGKGTRRSLTLLLLRLLLYVYRDALKCRGPVRYLVHRPVVLALLFVLVEPSAARGPRPPGGSAPEQTSTFVRHPSSCHALFFQKKKEKKEKRPLPSGLFDAYPRRRARVNPRSLAPGLNATCGSLATLGLSRMPLGTTWRARRTTRRTEISGEDPFVSEYERRGKLWRAMSWAQQD